MIYLDLFLGFLRVGLFAFGGAYGAIALIRDVVRAYGWLTDESLTCMIAVSESTPGPIMVNLATYVGQSQAGFWGAVVATFAVVLPSFVIILLVTVLLKNILKNPCMQAIFRGFRPCVVGIVLATGVQMICAHAFVGQKNPQWDIRAICLTAFLAVLLFGSKRVLKKKISPILLIVLAAFCGIAVYGG